jgi:hypothetical protein
MWPSSDSDGDTFMSRMAAVVWLSASCLKGVLDDLSAKVRVGQGASASCDIGTSTSAVGGKIETEVAVFGERTREKQKLDGDCSSKANVGLENSLLEFEAEAEAKAGLSAERVQRHNGVPVFHWTQE